MVFQTIESAYVDIVSEWGNFEYWVTAVDHNGNESDASEISGVELSIEQEAEIDTFVMLRRMALLAWIGSHIEAPEPQELAPGFASTTARLGQIWMDSLNGS